MLKKTTQNTIKGVEVNNTTDKIIFKMFIYLKEDRKGKAYKWKTVSINRKDILKQQTETET